MHYFGVDIGNSGCRVTSFDFQRYDLGHTTRVRWSYDTQPPMTAQANRFRPDDEAWLGQLVSPLSVTPATWLISSVRRDASQVLQRALAQRGHAVRVISYRDLPLTVALAEPAAVGIDRLLAALAAGKLLLARQDTDLPERILVIQAGSAVTVDQLHLSPAAGGSLRFEGGAIVPGVPMMLRLLGRGADLLPELEADDLTDLPPLPGKNTGEAMLCGAASALVGGVGHLVNRYRAELGGQLPVILSGGDGTRLAPYLEQPLVIQPDLVQHGLLVLAGKLRQKPLDSHAH